MKGYEKTGPGSETRMVPESLVFERLCDLQMQRAELLYRWDSPEAGQIFTALLRGRPRSIRWS